jgi:hypothetical protein
MKTLNQRLIVMLVALFTMIVTAPLQAALTNDDGSIVVYNQRKKSDYTFVSIAVENLKLLRETVRELGVTQHIETLQAMMMVETRAGTGGSVGLPTAHPSRRSYGVMQLTVPTARVLFRDHDDLRQQYFGDRPLKNVKDKEIITLLLKDPKLNIKLGVMLFVQYLDMVNNEWARAVAAYNMGIGNALKRKEAPKAKYVQDVRSWMPVVAALNEQLDKPIEQPETVLTNAEQYGPDNKENNDGQEAKGSEADQGTECDQSCERLGRAQEVQDNVSNNYSLFSAD